jgi:hypothetical protein
MTMMLGLFCWTASSAHAEVAEALHSKAAIGLVQVKIYPSVSG